MTTSLIPAATVSPLRQRLIADMVLRRFSAETQRNYLRGVGRLASFLCRSPDTATPVSVPPPDPKQRGNNPHCVPSGSERILPLHRRQAKTP